MAAVLNMPVQSNGWTLIDSPSKNGMSGSKLFAAPATVYYGVPLVGFWYYAVAGSTSTTLKVEYRLKVSAPDTVDPTRVELRLTKDTCFKS